MNKKKFTTSRGAKRFAPHQFAPAVGLLGPMPTILISKAAYDTMYHIVAESAEEVSWLGTVERDGMTFLIEEVFLFAQEVHATQTRFDEEAVGGSSPIWLHSQTASNWSRRFASGDTAMSTWV